MDKSNPLKKLRSLSFFGLLIPIIILVLGIGSSFWLKSLTKSYLNEQSKVRFDTQVAAISDEVTTRFEIYANGLYSVRGFFDSSDFVSPYEWNRYLLDLDIPKNYPGATNMSFIQAVSDKDKALLLQKIKSDYTASAAANIKIYPDSNTPSHYIYLYSGSNFNTASPSAVLGFDIGSDPARLDALEYARDNDLPTSSAITYSITTGIKILTTYIPIYKQNAASSSASFKPNTTSARREDLMGFGQISLQTTPFFQDVLNEHPLIAGIDFAAYDNNQLNKDHLIYATDQKLIGQRSAPENYLEKTTQLSIAERNWNFYFQAEPYFGLTILENSLPNLILFADLILSIFLATSLYLLMNSRSRALKLADKITFQLKDSEEKYRSMFESLQDVLYRTDNAGVITMITPSIEKYLGIKPEQAIGRQATDFYADPNKRQEMLTLLTQKKSINDFPIRLKGKDNHIIDVSLSAHILFDVDNKPVGLEGVLRDVTERRVAEQQLNEKTEQLERFNKLMLGRELKMTELKIELDNLKKNQ